MKIDDMQNKGFMTRCIHSGVEIDADTKAVKRPLVMSNNYELPLDIIDDADEWNNVWLAYARDLNANASWLADRLLALEGGEACVVTSSGVSAINGTLMTLLNTGDHIVSSEIVYGSVRSMLSDYFPNRFDIHTCLVDTSNPENVRQSIRPNTKMIHIETPGNPTTGVSDIAAIAELAHSAGILLSVDST